MTDSDDPLQKTKHRNLRFFSYCLAFGSESNIHNAQFDSTQVPKGALIKILQKGVFFAEAELYSVLDGEAIEKYERTSGTISLLESGTVSSWTWRWVPFKRVSLIYGPVHWN